MGKNKIIFRLIGIMIIIFGLLAVYLFLRLLWNIWMDNVFEIVTKLLFPAGKLYYN